MRRLLAFIGFVIATTAASPAVAYGAGASLPHGGYDPTSDACLQCHDIHEAGGDYVLMRWQTVTATCGSCHYLYMGEYPRAGGGSNGAGIFNPSPSPGTEPAYDPGYAGREVDSVLPTSNSLGSRTSAYETDYSTRAGSNGHTLQRGPGLHVFADGVERSGDYIPGGWDVLTAIEQAAYPNLVNTLSYVGTDGLYCGSCHTPHGEYGQQLSGAVGVQGGKLLTSKPNHGTTAVSVGSWAEEGSDWCLSCHQRRGEGAVDPSDGTIYHNHPKVACLVCHANDAGGGNSDFPHTSTNANLLALEPDALCFLCHKAGLMP